MNRASLAKHRRAGSLRARRGPKVAYRGSILTPARGAASLLYLADGQMIVGEDGRIESVGPAGAPHFAGVTHDLSGSLLVPGFVDTHVHYPQTRIVGSASGPLLEWLDKTVFAEEARFADAIYARDVAEDLIHQAVSNGTTTAAIFSSSSPLATEVLFEALAAHGLRAIVGLTLMDQACPDALRVNVATAMAASRDLVARFHGADEGRLAFAVTPRFALSCSRRLMEEAGALAAAHDLVVQTHVAENERELVEVGRAHPWAADYLDVYEKVGLLGPRTLLAHAIHLSASEWDRVAAAGAKIAHCPDSNFFLGSGRMRLDEPERRGVGVGLGSDVAAGRSFDMRRAIAYAYDNALAVDAPRSPAHLFAMATQGGADALGLGGVIGSLEAGKEADFVVLSKPSWADDEAAALRAVTFASDTSRVERSYVRGRLVHRSDGGD